MNSRKSSTERFFDNTGLYSQGKALEIIQYENLEK